MSKGHDIKPFLDDPSLLVETFRQVIEHLDSSGEDDETREKEAQLREIAKTIERLEKAGVAVPDVLRGEKTRLVSELAVKSDSLVAMNRLADEMEEALLDLRKRIGRDDQPSTTKRNFSNSPKTSMDVLREHILIALKKLGGSARLKDVLEVISKQLEGKFLPGDFEWRNSTHEYAWQNNTKWARFRMVKEGILRSDSPRGYWEINKDNT